MNILPRGVRLAFSFYYYSMLLVSIHAPTRGATICNRFYYWTVPVSIHAPTRGATVIKDFLALLLCFNPRTHEGCDSSSSQQTCIIKVSIHAPTRGATERKMLLLIADKVSIHAPTRGATIVAHYSCVKITVSIHAPTRGATCRSFTLPILRKFQSTHPRGVRQDS